jgi:hypothetical protein
MAATGSTLVQKVWSYALSDLLRHLNEAVAA